MTERDAPRRGETRDTIDRTAIELFADRGYNATSMRAIADAARVQPAAIYHWYPGKEAILIRLQNDFMERLGKVVAAAVDTSDSPVLRLAAAVREHVVFHGLNTKAAFVTDREIRALSPGPRKSLIQRRDSYQQLFRQMIEEGIAEGSFSASDSSVATYAILLQCTGVALWYKSGGPLDLERVGDLHVELVLNSLKAPPEMVETATGHRSISIVESGEGRTG
ncbi:MAG: TetR/AcrR family transcriptional regulator [Actinomycetota bacterium]|nr:TetR/AcrR family transcriptional regulator [Actinomycetota bacterium]